MASAASPSDACLDPRATPSASAAAGSVPPPSEKTIHKIPSILPRERVFPIQIGGELFKLSGASLSSDAPSYFSQYFASQVRQAGDAGEDSAAVRTLYIDRDPETFRDIALHLQGYHVKPRDGTHFVRLFADAQFYSLPKLISQLYEESIFISIGHREFQIPRDLLTDPRNSPNYFSLGFALFFSRPDSLFPGLDREDLFRPPSILPPAVPNRSADTFAELLRLLRGYEVRVRDEAHRRELLRDARYFHFKGLEQQLLPHHLGYNPLRGYWEVTMRLENVQKSGISLVYEQPQQQQHQLQHHHPKQPSLCARIIYARPYIDDPPSDLILEIGQQSSKIHFHPHTTTTTMAHLEFFHDTKTRVGKLLQVIASKLHLPPTTQPLMAPAGAASQPATPGNTPLSQDDLVRAVLGPEASIILDGREYVPPSERSVPAAPHPSLSSPLSAAAPASSVFHPDGDAAPRAHPRKRKRADGEGAGPEDGPRSWTVLTGQWRLRILPAKSGRSAVECVFVAVKIDAVSSERGRNGARGFL
ncbi:hypothetical protein E4U42_007043 [Claviceps africana]|uniref:Potassium channel tetramerisation-type BTB domain-containing protein n=1 Tax=Claviceps africana TaxID=83212 RepID=A0A8K0J4H2_9HYPO|nr:hypothetical protein E4U42_007043 [Claviceps africana]